MKKRTRILVSIFIAFMMAATIILAACPSRPSVTTPPLPLTGIAISLPTGAPMTWTIGEDLPGAAQRTFTATPTPANAEMPALTWASSNPAVVTVTNGVVTWPATPQVGYADITASGGGFTSVAVRITVEQGIPQIPLESIVITPNAVQNWVIGNIPELEARTFQFTLNPEDVSPVPTVVWHSSNTAVVTINAQGVASLPASPREGHAYITARVGTTHSNAVRINVEEPPVDFTQWILVSSAAEWNSLMEIEGWSTANIALTADLDFEGRTFIPLGNQELTHLAEGADLRPTQPFFRGILDGRGFAMRNILLAGGGWEPSAIISGLDGGTIRNLSVINARSEGNNRPGLLVTSMWAGTIQNVFIQGTIHNPGPADAANWARGGTVIGGNGDHVTSSDSFVFRNIVTDVTVTGSNQNRVHPFAGRLSGAAQTTAENIFIVLDGIETSRRGEITGGGGEGAVTPGTTMFLRSAIGTTNFTTLPASHWQQNAGVLPSLIEDDEVLANRVNVTGHSIYGPGFQVISNPHAHTGNLFAFSVRVNTTTHSGTPIVTATMGGNAVVFGEPSVTGPDNAREFTFVIPNVTGPISINSVAGLSRSFNVTRPSGATFTFTGDATIESGEDYEFEIEVLEGFEVVTINKVVGNTTTPLVVPTPEDGVYSFVIPAADIDADFAIEVDVDLAGGLQLVTGIRSTALYVINAPMTTDPEEDFEFTLNLTNMGVFPNQPNVTIAVTIEVLGEDEHDTHILTGVIAGGVVTFTLPSEYIEGRIVLGEVSGIYESAWVGISTAAQFNAIMQTPGWQTRNFYLVNDINFAGVAVTPIGGTASLALHGRLPAANHFRGIFDGRGFALQNITLQGEGHHWGLFRHLDGAQIRNLAITNMTATFQAAMNGMLAGWVNGSAANPTIIENVYLHGSVTGGYGAAGSAWLRSGALIGRSARADAADGVSHLIVRNNVINVTATGHSFAALIAYMPNGTVANTGNKTFQNNFVVTGGFTHHAGAGAPFVIQAGQWTHDLVTQSGNVGFAMADIDNQNFTALPEAFWDTEDGELPSLVELDAPEFVMSVPVVGIRTTSNYAITAPARATNNAALTFTVGLRGGNEAEEISVEVSVRGGKTEVLEAERNEAGNFEFTIDAEDIVGAITIGAIVGFTNQWTAISTAAEFNAAFTAPGWQDRNFYLTANINFATLATEEAPLVNGRANRAIITQEFRGVLDGRGFALQNFNLTGFADWTAQGLFQTTNGAIIRNIEIYNARIASPANYGQNAFLVGTANNSLIENIFINESVAEGGPATWYRQNAPVVTRPAQGTIMRNIVVNMASTVTGFHGLVERISLDSTVTNAFVVTDNMPAVFHMAGSAVSTGAADAPWRGLGAVNTTPPVEFNFVAANIHRFEMDDIEDINFNALPSSNWILEAGELPTLRTLPALTAPIPVLAADSVGVSTAQEFMAMTLDGNYHLTQNIDFTGVNFVPVGGGSHYLPAIGDAAAQWAAAFQGTFDGRGFALRNITTQSTTHWAWYSGGVFRQLDGATIRNLVVENATLQAATAGLPPHEALAPRVLRAGLLVGRMRNSTITNVSVSGAVNDTTMGDGHARGAGLIGAMITGGAGNRVNGVVLNVSNNHTGNFFGIVNQGGNAAHHISNVFVVNTHIRGGNTQSLFGTTFANATNVNAFAMADLANQDFSELPFTMWDTSGGLPTLRQLPL